MYSVVLMAALTAGSTTPDWHHCGGSCGYHAGHGGGYPGYCGSGYGGAYEGCGCWGGYNNWSYCGMPPPNTPVPYSYGVTGGMAVPGTGTGEEELGKPKTKKNADKETAVPTGAKFLVELPTNAKLFVDDMPVKAAAGLLTLSTPALEPDKDYFYMVRIEMMRDGQPISQTRRILVRAGLVSRADFSDLQAEVLKTAQVK